MTRASASSSRQTTDRCDDNIPINPVGCAILVYSRQEKSLLACGHGPATSGIGNNVILHVVSDSSGDLAYLLVLKREGMPPIMDVDDPNTAESTMADRVAECSRIGRPDRSTSARTRSSAAQVLPEQWLVCPTSSHRSSVEMHSVAFAAVSMVMAPPTLFVDQKLSGGAAFEPECLACFRVCERSLNANSLPGLRATCQDAPVGWVGLLLRTVYPLAIPVDGRRVSAHQRGAGIGAPLDG